MLLTRKFANRHEIRIKGDGNTKFNDKHVRKVLQANLYVNLINTI